MARDGEKIIKRGIYLYIDGKQVKNSITEIEKEMRAIERAQKKMTVGSQEYVHAGEKIRSLNGILSEHRAQLRAAAVETEKHSSSIGKLADGFNRYAGMAAGALATITGVTFTVRKAVEAYAEMQEAQAQVIKYTGFTKQVVEELNEEFKQMDTRTARDRLNELAGDAGRLGIKTKDAVLEFVDAADKINVALGEDLGKDAVKDIGKLAQMFGEDKTKGLRGAMLATGSAINEVAQNSSAAERYLVDFTARVGGAANQAHISQANILGFASVLDQNMQQVEMAGTAFQGVLMKMYQKPAKFAKMAGMDVKAFTKLLKEDANEAVLQFLSTLSKKGGLDKLAPLFESMKLDGARASGVLSTLAKNIDQIRIEQDRANKAYEEGTSILEEFNVQNNTIKADLEKKKKLFNDYIIDLGEKLLPVASKLVSTGAMGIKVLGTLTTFLIENKGAVIAAGLAVAAYYVAAERATIALRALSAVLAILKGGIIAYKGSVLLGQAAFYLLTGQVQKATVAMRAFSIVTKMSPVGALVALVVTLGSAFYFLTRKMDENERVQRKLLSLSNEAKAAAEREKDQVTELLRIARDYSKSYGERMLAIKKLNDISPEYLGVLNSENINTDKAKEAVDRYTRSLLLNMKMKRLAAAIDQNQDKLNELAADPTKTQKFYDGFLKMTADTFDQVSTLFSGHGSQVAAGLYDTIYGRYRDATGAIKAENEKLVQEMNKTQEELIKLESTNAPTNNNNNTGDGDDKEELTEKERKKKLQEAINKVMVEYGKKRNALRKEYIDGDIATQEEYEARLKALELESLQALMDVHGLKEKEQEEYQAKYFEIQVALRKKLEDINREITQDEEDEFDKQLNALRKKQEEQESEIRMAYAALILTEEEMQEKLLEIKKYYAKKEGEVTTKKLEKEKEAHEEASERLKKALLEKTADRFDALDNLSNDNLYGIFHNIKQLREVYQDELEELLDSGLDGEKLGEALEALEKKLKEKSEAIQEGIKALSISIGQDVGNMFTEHEDMLKSFLKYSLTLMLDAVEQYLMIARVKALAEAMTSFNLGAIAKAAANMAIVTAAFQVAKNMVKGFDKGGYTGDGPWNEPAGVVHRKEFVANRFAVANPNLSPVLSLVDAAQRSGTVSSLTSEDIAAVAGGGSAGRSQSSVASAPTSAAPDPGNSALLPVLIQVNRTLEQVKKRFDEPIVAETYATGKGGVNDAQKLVSRMEANASRKR